MRGTIWETQISSPNFQKLMLVESPVVSVVTSGLPIASIQHATDNHCENHISTHWHQHLPTRFSKKFHLVEINFHNDIRSLVSSEICCKRGYSVWLRVQTFPVGNHWCMNLKVLWITSENNNWKLKGLHWIQVIFFFSFFFFFFAARFRGKFVKLLHYLRCRISSRAQCGAMFVKCDFFFFFSKTSRDHNTIKISGEGNAGDTEKQWKVRAGGCWLGTAA